MKRLPTQKGPALPQWRGETLQNLEAFTVCYVKSHQKGCPSPPSRQCHLCDPDWALEPTSSSEFKHCLGFKTRDSYMALLLLHCGIWPMGMEVMQVPAQQGRSRSWHGVRLAALRGHPKALASQSFEVSREGHQRVMMVLVLRLLPHSLEKRP